MVGRMIICCLLFSLGAAAQEQKTPTFLDRIHQVQQFLDDRAKKKVDPDYIEVPDTLVMGTGTWVWVPVFMAIFLLYS